MKKFLTWFLPGVIIGCLFIGAGSVAVRKTSSNEYCASCHDIHPQATVSWKQAKHYITRSGIQVNCVDCHLPPHGHGYMAAKIRTGVRDVWSKWTKDPASFDWEEKSKPENAREFVYFEGYGQPGNVDFGKADLDIRPKFTEPARVTGFTTFTEQIPNSPVSFTMVAIPGGQFRMGSSDDEAGRKSDEGPVRDVKLDSFYMLKSCG